jgi:phosphoribosylanthranilate isomerase
MWISLEKKHYTLPIKPFNHLFVTRVKICGITELKDACVCVDAGAHALGFVFYRKSPRFVSFQAAARICRELPPFILKVGVFVNEKKRVIDRIAKECCLDILQLHGDESPDFCRKFDRKAVKAFQLRNSKDLKQLGKYDVDAFLLDTFSSELRGGTGRIGNWELALRAKRAGHPMILSGGLTSSNVVEAIQKVQPFAVDVSSGVEKSPGKKDHTKIRSFLRKVREA